MDKRYYLIIIILIVGFISLFFISNTSEMVGSASVNLENFTFTLPHGFMVDESKENSITLVNNDENLSMYINLINSSNDNFSSSLNWMENSSNHNILSEGSLTINGLHFDALYYVHYFDNTGYKNCSVFYFNMYGTDFKVEITGFNEYNKNQTIEFLTEFVNSLKPNYEMG